MAQFINVSHRTLKSLVLRRVLNCEQKSILLPLILRQCVHIEHLEVRDCKYSVDNGQEGNLVHSLTNLTLLALDTCDDKVLQELAAHVFPSLRSVGIGYHGSDEDLVTAQGIRRFTRKCPNLTALSIKKLNASGNKELSACALEHCALLQHLELCGLENHLEDELLKSAARYCPLLHTLNMSDCFRCRSDFVDLALRSCTKLCTLVISIYCGYKIRDKMLDKRVTVVEGGYLPLDVRQRLKVVPISSLDIY